MKELTKKELKETQGGHFWWGLVAGYVFGEVMQGIYQAE